MTDEPIPTVDQPIDDDGDDGPQKSYSQEQLEKKIQRRLSKHIKENETLKAQLAELSALKADAEEYRKIKESQKTESEKLQAAIAAEKAAREQAEAKLIKLEIDSLRAGVATDQKLPPSLIKYVQGTTKDEILESVKQVKADYGIKEDKGQHIPPNTTPDASNESAEMNSFLLGMVRGGGGR